MAKTNIAKAIVACVFDLDGTLVDTLDDFVRALNRMMRQIGRAPLPREAVGCMVGKGNEFLLRSALAWPDPPVGSAASAADEDLHRTAQELYLSAYRALNGVHSTVFPDVVPTLEALRARSLPLACLTNKPLHDARVLLDAKGLGGYFDHVFGGDSFARKKPDPLPLQQTCKALGVAPRHTLMVGDSVNDAAAARGSGCPVALVSYGYNHGRPVREIDADFHLDGLTELLDILGGGT